MPRVVQSPLDSVVSTVKCEIHPDKVYELYCEAHNDVLCVSCKMVYHSKCGVETIQSLAKDQNAAQLKKKSLASMESLWCELDKVKNEKQSEISREEGAMCIAFDQIETFKKKEIERIENLAQKSIDLVKLHDEKVKESIKYDLKSVEDQQRKIDGFQIQIAENVAANSSDLFVFEKLTARMKSNVDDFAGSLKMGFVDFVSVDVPSPTSRPYPTVPYSPYQLEIIYKDDILDSKSSCDLRDMCILDNGHVLLADFDNKCLRRFDCLYKVYNRSCGLIESCSLDGAPWGICSLGLEKVAVTLCVEKKVCFVFVGSRMQVTKTFCVGEECRGISYKDGLLYVGCWAKKSTPLSGEIKVFDLHGSLFQTFKTDRVTGNNLFNFITHLSSSSDGKCLYVSDLTDGKNTGKGLVILDVRSGILRKVADASTLSNSFSLGNGEFDEMIVGDREKKVVYRVDNNGHIIQELHNQIFASFPPQSVQYYRKHLVMTTRKSPKLFILRIN